MRVPFTAAAAASLILTCAEASTEDHRYKKGEHVELWVNKVRTLRVSHCLSFYLLRSLHPAALPTHAYRSNLVSFAIPSQVGPYANPQEAYEYYALPYCAPDTKHHPDTSGGRFNEWKVQNIGEHLGGHALRHSGHDITFLQTASPEKCTTKPLTKDEADHFSKAVLISFYVF